MTIVRNINILMAFKNLQLVKLQYACVKFLYVKSPSMFPERDKRARHERGSHA